MARLHRHISEAELVRLIPELLEYGSLRQGDKLSYQITLPLLERWLQETHPLFK